MIPPKSILLFSLVALNFPVARAQVFQMETFSGINADIPDGSAVGFANQQSFTIDATYITKVEVTLNIVGTAPAGAVNGDLYAYLSHGDALSVLVNRPGLRSGSSLGYDDNGMNNVVFSDGAANGDVHSYRLTLSGDHNIPIPGPLTGTWAPDGRAISPMSSGASFDGAPRNATLNLFNGLNPNGAWTLFLADLEQGGTARLDSWSLSVTAVPEPPKAALATTVVLLCYGVVRRLQKRKHAP